MLHIKMSKKRVSLACERAAAEVSKEIMRASEAYKKAREDWNVHAREHGLYGSDSVATRKLDTVTRLKAKRQKLYELADMATHSVGDVYVSPELWVMIKGRS